MGFYIRKSVSIGPLRLNLSNSGLGASVGVKGLRFGVGPSGTYVHAGVGGLYYRSSLDPRRARAPRAADLNERLQREIEASMPSKWQEIDSGTVDLMVDSSAEAVIEQLKSRNATSYWFQCILAAGIILSVVALAQMGLGAPKFVWTTTAIVWAALLGLAIAATIAGSIWGYRRDEITRGGVAFLYELDQEIQGAYERVYLALENLAGASVKYLLTSTASVEASQARYHAGVNTLIKTSSLNLNLTAPSRVSANVPIPCLAAGNETLCFFPERLIILQGSGTSERIGAVPYSQLKVSHERTNFTLDTDIAPPNTEVVGHTWQYVNKNGSPDRRFKNNRRLAKIACECVGFGSATGLNEAVLSSTPGLGRELATAVERLAALIGQGAEVAPKRSTPAGEVTVPST